MNINSVVVTGRLGQDISQKFLPSGKAVANFSIATDSGYGDNKQTHWLNIVAFDKTAESATKNLRKGSHVGIEGRLQTRSYDNRDGQKVTVTEVVANRVIFLDSRAATAGGGADDSPFD